MRPGGTRLPIDARTAVVWAGSLATGVALWEASGTALAGGLVVLAVLLASASPTGALYATCAAIPLIFHPVTIGSLQLGLLEIGTLATAAGFAFHTAYESFLHGRRPQVDWVGPYVIWVLPLLLFLIAAVSLVTMPYADHRAEALRTWRWVVVEPLTLFVVARWTITKQGSIPLVSAIILPAAVVAGSAIWQIVESTSSFAVDDVQRSTATYLHPNNLALYLERGFFLALIPGMLVSSRLRLPLLAIAAIVATGIVATFSRGALFGLIAGGSVFLLAHPIRFGWRTLGWIVISVSGLFLLLARQRFAGADSSGYLETRRILWRDATAMLRDFPVSGIGLDQFLWLHQSRYIDPRIWSERYTSHPHNLLLDAWLSLGLAGAVLLLIFVGVGARFVWMVRNGTRAASPWQLGALACLGAGLGHSMVDNGYFLSDLAAMTWLSIAIIVTSASPTAIGVAELDA